MRGKCDTGTLAVAVIIAFIIGCFAGSASYQFSMGNRILSEQVSCLHEKAINKGSVADVSLSYHCDCSNPAARYGPMNVSRIQCQHITQVTREAT